MISAAGLGKAVAGGTARPKKQGMRIASYPQGRNVRGSTAPRVAGGVFWAPFSRSCGTLPGPCEAR